jgi:hypothetical protein
VLPHSDHFKRYTAVGNETSVNRFMSYEKLRTTAILTRSEMEKTEKEKQTDEMILYILTGAQH